MRHGFITVSAAMLLAMASSSFAADLGGNCCADLEERVAELEMTAARKGNRKVSLEVSGHINEAILWTDDGADVAIINNPNSSGRFRFRGSGKINSDWDAGFLMELGVNHNAASGDEITVRHQALYLRSKAIGTIWLGQTSQATDGITEIDLSKASLGDTLMNLTVIGGSFGLDGSRQRVVKYVSPELSGFNLSASWSDSNDYDVALRFANEVGDFRYAVGVGYRHVDGVADDGKVISGSLSIMHTKSGIFVSGSAGQNKNNGGISLTLFDTIVSTGISSVKQWAVRGGIEKKWSDLGTTTFYGEYSSINIKDSDGDPSYWGVGIVQAIDPAASEVYVAYRSLDGNGDDGSTWHAVAGIRIKF